ESCRGFRPAFARAKCLVAHHQGLRARSVTVCGLLRFAGMEADRSHCGTRISVATLREEIKQNFRGARFGCGTVSLSLAGARRRGGAESGETCSYAEASQETSAG